MVDRKMEFGLRILFAVTMTLLLLAGTETAFAQKSVSATTFARFRVVAPVGINGVDIPGTLLTLRSSQEYAPDEVSGTATPANDSEPGVLNETGDEMAGVTALDANGRTFIRIDSGDDFFENLETGDRDPMILVALTGN